MLPTVLLMVELAPPISSFAAGFDVPMPKFPNTLSPPVFVCVVAPAFSGADIFPPGGVAVGFDQAMIKDVSPKTAVKTIAQKKTLSRSE